MPVTRPSVPMEATLVLLLLHEPPVVASLKDVVPGRHMAAAPEIGAGETGSGLTVTSVATAVLPQLLVSA